MIKALGIGLAATLLLFGAGCSTTKSREVVIPTYEDASASKFLQVNREASRQILAGLDPRFVSPLLVATVVDVNDLRQSSPLGRTLSEQYTSAAAASGIDVREIKLRGDVFVREQTGELLLSRELKDIAKTHNATAVLVGTYSAASQFTYVSLKLVRTDTGQILRGHDYALPMERDVQKLLQPYSPSPVARY